jgi:hypothetical protein
MLTIVGLAIAGVVAPAAAAADAILRQTFDLAADRSPQVQHYVMESRLLTYALDGTRVGTDVYRLRLKCVPAGLSGKTADEYTCAEFTVQFAGSEEVPVPALRNWTYPFGPPGIDDKGQVFGIDHGRFANLVDAKGTPIPPDKSYHVYNAFIDFHSFCNVFARPVEGARGIQDLKQIGDKIIHAAAFTEPPVHLGSSSAKGSTFKNGEVTLAFKGLSTVDGAACAIVAYDSGESSFKMLANPMPSMEVRSVGSSHYLGDLYIDLASQWVRKATMYELVVTETTVSTVPNKINGVIERDILIRNVSEKEFTRR